MDRGQTSKIPQPSDNGAESHHVLAHVMGRPHPYPALYKHQAAALDTMADMP